MEVNPLKENGFIPADYSKDNYKKTDLHRPYVDGFILVSPSGKRMKRETDLIDVWFDSGAMPFAQMGLEKLGSTEFGHTEISLQRGRSDARMVFYTSCNSYNGKR